MVRSKSDITDEQYTEFYKHVAHDFEDPLCWTHARVEGKVQEYTQLLYIPARAIVRYGIVTPLRISSMCAVCSSWTMPSS